MQLHPSQLAADARGAAQHGPTGRAGGGTRACVHHATAPLHHLPAPRRQAYKVPPGQGGVLVRKVYPVGSAAGQLQEGDVLQRRGSCSMVPPFFLVRPGPSTGMKARTGRGAFVFSPCPKRGTRRRRELRRGVPTRRLDGTDIAPDGSVPFRESERISFSELAAPLPPPADGSVAGPLPPPAAAAFSLPAARRARDAVRLPGVPFPSSEAQSAVRPQTGQHSCLPGLAPALPSPPAAYPITMKFVGENATLDVIRNGEPLQLSVT